MKQILSYIQFAALVGILFSLLFVAGCKSKKVTLVDSDGVLRAKTHNEVLDDILSHELDYRTITTKGSVSLKGKKLTAVFKLVKNEVLQASLRMPIIGSEAIRLDITPEKIVLIDRLGGKYAEVDIQNNEVSDLVAFNFYNLQALLTNQLFLAGEQSVSKKDYSRFKVGSLDNKYLLETKDQNDIEYLFSVNPAERIISAFVNSPSRQVSLLWNYDKFVEDDTHIYPTDMMATIKIKEKTMALGISYDNLDVNTEFKVDTSIPSRYEKIDVMDLLGAYMKIK